MRARAVPRPPENEYAPFYAGYVAEATETDVLGSIEGMIDEVLRLPGLVPPEHETFRYAPGKWSIREVLGHIIDAERVFGYRALCIARGDTTPLPGFDEIAYVAGARYDESNLTSLAAEFANLRRANVAMLGRFDEAAWLRIGIANGKPVSARAVAFIMSGHARHHLRILRERYGVGTGS